MHTRTAPHVSGSVVEHPRKGRPSALDWLEADVRKPCPRQSLEPDDPAQRREQFLELLRLMRKVDLQLASDALVLEADRGDAAELARCLGLRLPDERGAVQTTEQFVRMRSYRPSSSELTAHDLTDGLGRSRDRASAAGTALVTRTTATPEGGTEATRAGGRRRR
jgi:hypothetical protein